MEGPSQVETPNQAKHAKCADGRRVYTLQTTLLLGCTSRQQRRREASRRPRPALARRRAPRPQHKPRARTRGRARARAWRGILWEGWCREAPEAFRSSRFQPKNQKSTTARQKKEGTTCCARCRTRCRNSPSRRAPRRSPVTEARRTSTFTGRHRGGVGVVHGDRWKCTQGFSMNALLFGPDAQGLLSHLFDVRARAPTSPKR